MWKPRQVLFVAVLVPLLVTAFLRGHSSRTATAGAALQGDPAHPAQTHGWVETRLYFGIGPAPGDASAAETRWRNFLDAEVTPRFPSGLSVVDVYGQWQRSRTAAPQRERSKMLIVDYPATPENAARIEAIRAAWKQRTHAQSVLKVTQPADVSF